MHWQPAMPIQRAGTKRCRMRAKSTSANFTFSAGWAKLAIDNTSGHVDHSTVRAFFDDDRVAQVGRWVTARFRQTSTRSLPWRCAPHTIPLQQGVGVVWQGITGEEW